MNSRTNRRMSETDEPLIQRDRPESRKGGEGLQDLRAPEHQWEPSTEGIAEHIIVWGGVRRAWHADP